MILLDLPFELIEEILGYINDTKTYLNCRYTCKVFNIILKDGKIFSNKELKYNIKFLENRINFYNTDDELVREIIFKSYGDIETINRIYSDFDSYYLKMPYKLTIVKKTEKGIEEIKFDVKTYKISKNKIDFNLPLMCNIS